MFQTPNPIENETTRKNGEKKSEKFAANEPRNFERPGPRDSHSPGGEERRHQVGDGRDADEDEGEDGEHDVDELRRQRLERRRVEALHRHQLLLLLLQLHLGDLQRGTVTRGRTGSGVAHQALYRFGCCSPGIVPGSCVDHQGVHLMLLTRGWVVHTSSGVAHQGLHKFSLCSPGVGGPHDDKINGA